MRFVLVQTGEFLQKAESFFDNKPRSVIYHFTIIQSVPIDISVERNGNTNRPTNLFYR